MRKIMGTLAIAVLALTACGAPAETSSIQPLVGSAPAVTITAAPIPAQAEAVVTTSAANDYGKYTQDEFFIASVAPAWRGTRPTDAQFISAAKLVCEQLGTGSELASIRGVEGSGEDADWNNDRIVQSAIRVYCPAEEPQL